ncbi:mannose-1-phosphate guanylyltransferase [Klugiella xanthotipulae]|uniref:Mannose-1-phosphate guanylyltransferase n=1 Tax=Klugiella xanthotipulae TaxID=244735 RepID=A0A543HYP9_9MICO|nr:mannose-1-phosphate guanylyltransferase [Klugiella xanthotipulae]TQM63448.1 mannose-1-phosphate guanylyltransferase [Klugiella xanthotipulae]
MNTSQEFDRFYSIIPAGGVGSRLWPLSRADAPKFLLDLTGSGQSLLCDTWDRVTALAGPDRVMVVTGRTHRRAVCEQLPHLGESNTVLEAQPKDSSAAIGLAAAILEKREPGVIVGSFAADHVIRGQLLFRRAVAEAVALADAGRIVTIGIAPTEASVGFGYIHTGEPIDSLGGRDSYEVRSFVEKPDAETAQQYLASGEYLWNAGMFISRADVLLDQMAQSEPELVANLRALAEVWDTPQRDAAVDRIWDSLPKVAIDYTVAEPAAERGAMACVAAHFEWDDVGDFASVAKLLTRGRPSDLAVLGHDARILSDASNGIVVAQSDRLISLIGLENIVVVDTPDVLLITTKENAQKVKSVVDLVKRSGESTVL